MAGVPSCWMVSATQWDDEDTIQETLGMTLKTRDKWGHERGHRHGREYLLCSVVWAMWGSVCIFFQFWWPVETRLRRGIPHGGSPRYHTRNTGQRHVNKSVFLTSSFKHVRSLLLLSFQTHDRFMHLFIMRIDSFTFCKKRVICALVAGVFLSSSSKSNVMLTKQRMQLCFTVSSTSKKKMWGT